MLSQERCPLDLWTSATGRTAVVTPRGELDIARTHDLRRCLYEVGPTTTLVLVDLQHVTFLDSSILGVLVGGVKRCTANGTQLMIVNAAGIPLKALTLTGLTHLLPEADRKAAAPRS
jgi:anti-anti-sigma factor